MRRSTLIREVIFLITGTLAGLFIMDANHVVTTPVLPSGFDLTATKDFFLPLCRSTVIQAALIFVSGFLLYPRIVSASVFLFRGLSFGLALSTVDFSNPRHTSIMISYAVITVLFLILSASSHDFSKGKKEYNNLCAYSYNFFMICGACIVVRSTPIIIVNTIL